MLLLMLLCSSSKVFCFCFFKFITSRICYKIVFVNFLICISFYNKLFYESIDSMEFTSFSIFFIAGCVYMYVVAVALESNIWLISISTTNTTRFKFILVAKMQKKGKVCITTASATIFTCGLKKNERINGQKKAHSSHTHTYMCDTMSDAMNQTISSGQ